MKDKKVLIMPEHRLSVRRQCELIGLCRSSLYYENEPISPEDIDVMRRLDALHLEFPYYGSRNLSFALGGQGLQVNRKRVQRLMRIMGLVATAPGPHTSRRHSAHPVYPYLLRGLTIDRADHVWATDITYIPQAHGFGYLVAVIDWFSRAVLSWRLSNTLETGFCVEALQDALARYGPPKIFNTDQGAQFTDSDFTDVLKEHGVAISMDGKGRCLDNVFVERLWRSLKYEEVYLHAYEDLHVARRGIGNWMEFYNRKRPHQALGMRHPMDVYLESRLTRAA